MKFPEVPGKTPYDRFVNLVRHVIAVPKADVDEHSAKKRRKRKQQAVALTGVLLLLSVLAGCGSTAIRIRPTTVTVPNTPDAQACWRQCEQIKATCLPGCRGSLFQRAAVQTCVDSCADNRDQCLRGCPGSTDAGSLPTR